MSDTLFLSDIHYKARADNMPLEEVIGGVVDEIADIDLTHTSDHLGGAAEIEFGPLTLSFTRIMLKGDVVHLKGPMGRTVARIEDDTELSENIVDFAEEHDDILYEKREVNV